VTVITDPGGFAMDGGAQTVLPAGETLTQSQVVFMPDGGSSGGAMMLAAGSRQIAISVNWLTGRVLARELGGP
jgi:hypothetical protein